ncbi:MAG: hypothetical protein SGJ09_04715 [Phycisphaerae bacterium]|nr:hypothetical protein [Phycisphaerae bacterium]
MTSFIRSKNLVEEYHAWAVKASADMVAKAKADAAAREAKFTAAEATDAKRKAAARLQMEAIWDKIPYSTGIDYNYKFSQSSATGSSSSSGSSTSGNGSYDGDKYWNGSYYNGYADSYHDIWGVPAGAAARAGGAWDANARVNGRGTGAYHASGSSSISPPHAAAPGRAR